MAQKYNSKESIADNISNILNAVPKSFDGEEDELDQTSAKVSVPHHDNDDDLAEGVERSKIRTQNVDLLDSIDEKYAGKISSRKRLRESSDESDFGNGNESATEDNSLDGEDNGDEEMDDYDTGSDEEMDDEEEGDSGDEENDNKISHSESEDEQDNSNFKHFKESQEPNHKGVCVRNQLSFWESLLEIRIQLQKCLVASNKMPFGEKFNELSENGGEEFEMKLSETKKSITNVLNKMMNLQTIILQNNPETKKLPTKIKKTSSNVNRSDEEITSEDEDISEISPEKHVRKKRKKNIDNIEETIAEKHELYRDYRNNVINKWNDKTKIGTLSKNNSRSHSILKDIEIILSDKPRLIKKTQLKRSNYQILGEGETENDTHNENIFDDDDFYHQLLHELIEFKSSDVTDPVQLGRQWVKLQSMRSKMKRKVDTRATKGRKIRYTVHTKLVNFMAPIDNSTWTDEAKSEFFKSLFGKKQLK